MAEMLPNVVQWDLPRQIAEKKVYDLCRTQLPSDYLVFYSASWQALDKQRRPQDGEIDFILVHPSHGLLILEIKGGREIGYNPSTDSWYSVEGNGNHHYIGNPVRQAVRNKHNLKDLLRIVLRDAKASIPIAHAVGFPGAMTVDTGILRADLTREIVLTNSDLADLQGWLDGVWAYYQLDASHDTSQMPAIIKALSILLGRSLAFRPAMWGSLVDETNDILRLTQEQYAVLDILQFKRRALIWGCAGSGKTMIATEKAVRLARQGFSVLLTCFNKGLAAFLRTRITSLPDGLTLPLTIASFHDYSVELAAKANIILPSVEHRGQSYYDDDLPMALMEAADQLQARFDAIIVDEGQDFRNDWWASLLSLLHDQVEGILYIFYDEDQRIYPRTGNFPIQDDPFPLTYNCRNTKAIHRQMLKFYSGALQLSSIGPQGRPVQVLRYAPSDGLQAVLSRLLRNLTQEARIPPHEIVILTPTRKNSTLWTYPVPGPLSLSDLWPPPPDSVFSTTVHAFKGLEASVVILIEPHLWPAHYDDPDRAPIESVLYVATSRARNHLIVLLPDDVPPTVSKYFPKA